MRIIEAHTNDNLATVGALFTKCVNSIEIILCFQSFVRELAVLPGKYALPEGRLFRPSENGRPAGCVALQRIQEGVCGLKRLYVRPAFGAAFSLLIF